ncbi:Rossmann-fold NAD(P)-binding domain-containing protein [Streptomyces edwardsiae]|uniref:D-isomer specific 2-hydroxyacid dehydrogenase NAD-binding domain-containing protein n=1 Tax=Streptomyces edwardsiae TaxID=3075527 RepID=A0ABU2Q5K9_9ACTN|nr:hypothetical protein [Streptomyces sp. DSM 41636]MDT0398519.1 hypothetical protein [Streptomyces sp. DSM 41636]
MFLGSAGDRAMGFVQVATERVETWLIDACVIRSVIGGGPGTVAPLRPPGESAAPACPGRTCRAIRGAGPVGRACATALAPYVDEIAFAAWPSLPDTCPPAPATSCRRGRTPTSWRSRSQNRRRFCPEFLTRERERRPLLICVGRLGTLDVDACLRALVDDWLGGLALDPIEQADLPLWPADAVPGPLNLLATPHIGAERPPGCRDRSGCPDQYRKYGPMNTTPWLQEHLKVAEQATGTLAKEFFGADMWLVGALAEGLATGRATWTCCWSPPNRWPHPDPASWATSESMYGRRPGRP